MATIAEGERYLMTKDVLRVLNISRTVLYDWIRKGIFPRPIKIPGTYPRWRASTIDEWMAQQDN